MTSLRIVPYVTHPVPVPVRYGTANRVVRGIRERQNAYATPTSGLTYVRTYVQAAFVGVARNRAAGAGRPGTAAAVRSLDSKLVLYASVYFDARAKSLPVV